jgi:hypothetical protein
MRGKKRQETKNSTNEQKPQKEVQLPVITIVLIHRIAYGTQQMLNVLVS